MVLRHSSGLEQEAAAVEAAVAQVLEAGHRTADIARGSDSKQHLVSTTEMGTLVRDALAESLQQWKARPAVHAS
jgi:3-isopropylmalate dehydrogenase